MKAIVTKQAIAAAVLTILMSTAAHAQFASSEGSMMIDNKAQAYVGGGITQNHGNDRGFDSRAVLNVGSVRAKTALSNDAQGRVEGRIVQDGGKANIARIGSIEADQALGNKARGVVRGNVIQQAKDPWDYDRNTVLEVGSVHARDTALGNTANGVVEGDIRQIGGGNRLHIGSIGPR